MERRGTSRSAHLQFERQRLRHWYEEYPDGFASVFKVLGHGRVGNMEGTIAAKVAGDPNITHTANDGTLQAFIPDKGSERMHHLCRASSQGARQWWDAGEMQEIQ